jgi:hypothetical protein
MRTALHGCWHQPDILSSAQQLHGHGILVVMPNSVQLNRLSSIPYGWMCAVAAGFILKVGQECHNLGNRLFASVPSDVSRHLQPVAVVASRRCELGLDDAQCHTHPGLSSDDVYPNSQARRGEADTTPDDIVRMVKEQIAPQHRYSANGRRRRTAMLIFSGIGIWSAKRSNPGDPAALNLGDLHCSQADRVPAAVVGGVVLLPLAAPDCRGEHSRQQCRVWVSLSDQDREVTSDT